MWECKYCKNLFKDLTVAEKANHSRWCSKNPKRKEYENNLSLARQNIKVRKNQYSYGAVCSDETRKKLSIAGKNRKHTEETKNIIREKALSSNHRRILKSTRKYLKKDGSQVLLDSSWEEALAKRLDELNVKWTRPSPVKWVDITGKEHNYFPDFYLEDYDLYLDPKNDIVYKKSLEKIDQIRKVLPNLKILRSLQECETFSLNNTIGD